ncbi:uncharacterized protein LOC128732543 [Sabethes cyaneus]|uniref:uncharacterized protein LOC128732543 n=1 Tax=Sabethes cyaneus TaxID=53552 RepID=UPI00237D9FA3|nr:uncharacterized protein LOC128732543 [Sabethes cyaneus]
MFESARQYWNVLRSPENRLRVAQVVIGIIVLGVEFPKPLYYSDVSMADYILFFFTFNATLLTLVRLIDTIRADHPIEKVFGEELWFRTELRFTGLMTLALCFSAWAVFLVAIAVIYFPAQNIVGGVFGFALSGLYLVDWWQLFQKRRSARADTGADDAELAVGRADDVKGSFLAVNLGICSTD